MAISASGKVPERNPPARRRGPRPAAAPLALGALALLIPATARAQQPARYFRENCTGCHTIGGGPRTGPDLKGVTVREDRAWLLRWLQDPTAVIAGRDPRVLRMVQESHGVIMPAMAGMTPAMAGQLLDLIAAESSLPQSQFAGITLDERPFTPADVAFGKELFLGQSSLRNGGSGCVGCHTVGTLGQLGGGGLGPDLTLAYVRLGDRQGLGTWLLDPPPGTMQALYKNNPLEPGEAFALVAFLAQASQQGRPASAGPVLHFFLIAFAATLVLLVGFEVVRRRSSRGKVKP
jgi:mono/diheme cytochrome c family protein